MKREKKILLLMREYVLGGAETQFRYLIEYAKQHKWKLDVVIEHDLQMQDLSIKKLAPNMENVRFYELNGGRESGKMLLDLLHYIIMNIIYVKYSACLIYYPKDLAFAPFIRAFGIRVVYSERVDAEAIISSVYYQRCLQCCNRILANSEYAKEELEKLTGRKVILIRNGKPVIQELPLKEQREILSILVPARIAPPKNQILSLYFLKSCQNFAGKIVFAGLEEDKAYYGKLKQFVRKNGLEDKVEFLGYVEDMAEEYRKADLVLLPSFAEGTPNVVLEAYAYSRPIIVSDIAVERNIVRDPRLRFSVKDPEGIWKCIRYVEDMSDNVYNQLLKKNREMILRYYNIEKMAESFYAVLTKWHK